MKTIEETILNAQNEWDALFSKHRLDLVTSVSTTTLNHLENLKLQDIYERGAEFQKNSITYKLLCLESRQSYQDIYFFGGKQELFCIQPDPYVSYSEAGLNEDALKVKPFFEDAYHWFKRHVKLFDASKEYDCFIKVKEKLVGKSIDDFVQKKTGEWVILVEGNEFPVKKKG